MSLSMVAAAMVVSVCRASTTQQDFTGVGILTESCSAPHPTRAHSGMSLIQARTAVAPEKVVDPDPHDTQLLPDAVLSQQKGEENLQNKDTAKKCCNCCKQPTTPGYCAAFGDPHFTTFDGAHTILLKEQTLWLVRSQNIWIQAVADGAAGDLMGLAVGGPFMHGHTLIVYNSSLTDPGTNSSFTILFDDKTILDAWDEQGRAEFSKPEVVWAERRVEWNSFMHDKHILNMEEAIKFDVADWAGRFLSKPKGGIYLFRLPEGVELTATGVDLLSAVIRMRPQEGGQSGYCGNFNGDKKDEYDPPIPGSVPEELVPAWNTAVGKDLEPVDDSVNLFKASARAAIQTLLSGISASGSPDVLPEHKPCPQDLHAKAESRCSQVEDEALHAACIFDVCNAGSPDAEDIFRVMSMMEHA